MRISRLFYPKAIVTGEKLALDEKSAHYLKTVLRLKKSAEIIVFTGQGGEFQAEVIETSRKQVVLNIKQWVNRDVESPLQINFGLAISRGDRMDLAVQKAVELGVYCITPLVTKRCVVQLKGEKKTTKIAALAEDYPACCRTKW
jgi:16S rRNA (uracil1498-N3)-methyltransferase